MPEMCYNSFRTLREIYFSLFKMSEGAPGLGSAGPEENIFVNIFLTCHIKCSLLQVEKR